MARAPELRQLPLDLSRRPGFSRDELVVTAANAEAVALVDRWPDWPSPVAVLAGPPGSGKSHMAALWADRAAFRAAVSPAAATASRADRTAASTASGVIS